MDIEVLEKNNVAVNAFYRKATYEDEAIVVNILCISFKNDPHMKWLLEKCRNPEKLKIMMTYLFHKTLKIGEIYLSFDEKAVALWKSEIKEDLSIDHIMRNLRFFTDIGLISIIRILYNEKFTHQQYPKRKRFFHLYLIGVLPECQGKGYASKLMNPILGKMTENSIPVYLETANTNNVKIYEKKGFKVYDSWFRSGLKLFYMKKEEAPIEK